MNIDKDIQYLLQVYAEKMHVELHVDEFGVVEEQPDDFREANEVLRKFQLTKD